MSTDRFPQTGDRMRFLGRNGYDAELEQAHKIFVVGQEYEVQSCEVGGWHHSIVFVGIPGAYNGVMFELVAPPAHPCLASGNDRWDNHFLGMALHHAGMSKDPSTKVGSVIVGPDREVRSMGFNGFPRGIADTVARLNDRDTKLKLVVHAEMNAILAAARIGVSVKGCTLYLCATDHTGLIWGGAPCGRCVVEIIQAGIVAIVTRPFKTVPSRWADDIAAARELLSEANIDYREVPLP